jgi:hypothetical protein
MKRKQSGMIWKICSLTREGAKKKHVLDKRRW